MFPICDTSDWRSRRLSTISEQYVKQQTTFSRTHDVGFGLGSGKADIVHFELELNPLPEPVGQRVRHGRCGALAVQQQHDLHVGLQRRVKDAHELVVDLGVEGGPVLVGLRQVGLCNRRQLSYICSLLMPGGYTERQLYLSYVHIPSYYTLLIPPP